MVGPVGPQLPKAPPALPVDEVGAMKAIGAVERALGVTTKKIDAATLVSAELGIDILDARKFISQYQKFQKHPFKGVNRFGTLAGSALIDHMRNTNISQVAAATCGATPDVVIPSEPPPTSCEAPPPVADVDPVIEEPPAAMNEIAPPVSPAGVQDGVELPPDPQSRPKS